MLWMTNALADSVSRNARIPHNFADFFLAPGDPVDSKLTYSLAR